MNNPAPAPRLWTETAHIHSYDVDFKHQATPEALCRLFLEGAWNHAEALGFGFSHLAQQKRFWVIARLLVKIDHYPRWGDKVLLNTWPRRTKTVFALRDFELTNPAGTALGGGTSAWLVLDAATRKPQRLDNLLASLEPVLERRALGQDPGKLPQFEPGSGGTTLSTRYSDVDVNNHVNSARYIGWMMDSYPLEFHHQHSVRQVEVNYVGETLGGETVTLCTQPIAPAVFAHTIRKPGGDTVCRGRLEWG